MAAWKTRRLARRISRTRLCLVGLAAVLCCLFVLDCRRQGERDGQVDCYDVDSKAFIVSLCRNYTNGLVTGSMCHPLCFKHEISYIKCLGHKSYSLVVLAKWKEVEVVLKADIKLHQTISLHFEGEMSDHRLSLPYGNSSKFKRFLTDSYKVPHGVAERILSECDTGSDGHLTNREALYCWYLADSDEVRISLQLDGLNVVPQLYGTCGNLVVVEFVPTFPFNVPYVVDKRSWSMRARLAVSLIEMLERLSVTNLLLCDFQESNFGVLQADDKFVAMSIDNDLSIEEDSLIKSMSFEKNNSCASDDDCAFIDCVVKCDVNRGKCSGVLASNNLQLLCRQLFVTRHRLMYPLLHDPPPSIERDLKSLLHQCMYPLVPSTQISTRLAQKLKTVLSNSY